MAMSDDAKARGRETQKKNREVLRAIEKKPASELEITHRQQLALRRTTFDVVMTRMEIARDVIDGHKTWSNQQVRLFGMLLNKVMPDLKYSKSEIDHTVNREPHELTREELEKMVAESSRIIEHDDGDE